MDHSTDTFRNSRSKCGLRVPVISQDQFLQINNPTDARIRPSPEEMRMECERWLGPNRLASDAYPWDHTSILRHRLTFFDFHRGRRLTQNDLDPWLKHINLMMFSNGDGIEALLECQLFMLETVWSQMNKLIKACWQRAIENRRNIITHEDVLYQMRNNFERTGRLMGHVIVKALQREQINTSPLHHHQLNHRLVVDPGQEILQILQEHKPEAYEAAKYFRDHCSQLYEAVVMVNEEMLMLCSEESYSQCLDPLFSRYQRLFNRDKLLNSLESEVLDEARKITFTSRSGRKSAFFAERYHCFLGRPPIETDLIYVLDYLAQEIVADLVDSASRYRDEELEGTHFDDVWHGDSEDVIQIRHYEKAFEQSPGVLREHNLLFGADDDLHISWEARAVRRQRDKVIFDQYIANKVEVEMGNLSVKEQQQKMRTRRSRARSQTITDVACTIPVPHEKLQKVWKHLKEYNSS